MGQARGYKGRLVVDFETTFGANPGVPAAKVLPINSYDVGIDRQMKQAQTLTGNRNPVQPFAGFTKLEGSAVVPLDLIAFGWWLKGMFGAPATTGSGPYTHVFKVGDTQPSMVAEKKYDFMSSQKYVRQNGVKISTLGLKFGGDDELVANLGIIGATEQAPSGTPYQASPTNVAFNRVSNFEAAITEGGSAIATVTEAEINVDFGLDAENFVIGGGGVLGDLPEGIAGVSGSITALFDSDALLTKALNSTESSLAITLTKATHSLKFEVPELLYSPKSPGITGPKGVKITLPFQGYYNDGAGASAFIATLINAQATYA